MREKSLKDIKILGGIGALLPLFGFLPKIGWILSFVSFIILIFAIKKLADISEQRKIFTNYLISFLLNIGAGTMIFLGLVGFLGTGILGWWRGKIGFAFLRGVLFFLGCAIVGWILEIVGALFLKKSFQEIGKRFKTDIFSLTGVIFFIGALLSPLLIGILLIIPIGSIFTAVSFLSLPDKFTLKENQP